MLALAERRGVAPAQVGARLAARPARGHLTHRRRHEAASTSTDAVAAVDLELTDDEIAELGADYVPHAIAGHR